MAQSPVTKLDFLQEIVGVHWSTADIVVVEFGYVVRGSDFKFIEGWPLHSVSNVGVLSHDLRDFSVPELAPGDVAEYLQQYRQWKFEEITENDDELLSNTIIDKAEYTILTDTGVISSYVDPLGPSTMVPFVIDWTINTLTDDDGNLRIDLPGNDAAFATAIDAYMQFVVIRVPPPDDAWWQLNLGTVITSHTDTTTYFVRTFRNIWFINMTEARALLPPGKPLAINFPSGGYSAFGVSADFYVNVNTFKKRTGFTVDSQNLLASYDELVDYKEGSATMNSDFPKGTVNKFLIHPRTLQVLWQSQPLN